MEPTEPNHRLRLSLPLFYYPLSLLSSLGLSTSSPFPLHHATANQQATALWGRRPPRRRVEGSHPSATVARDRRWGMVALLTLRPLLSTSPPLNSSPSPPVSHSGARRRYPPLPFSPWGRHALRVTKSEVGGFAFCFWFVALLESFRVLQRRWRRWRAAARWGRRVSVQTWMFLELFFGFLMSNEDFLGFVLESGLWGAGWSIGSNRADHSSDLFLSSYSTKLPVMEPKPMNMGHLCWLLGSGWEIWHLWLFPNRRIEVHFSIVARGEPSTPWSPTLPWTRGSVSSERLDREKVV